MSQRQQQYLDAMGITLWQRRNKPLPEVVDVVNSQAVETSPQLVDLSPPPQVLEEPPTDASPLQITPLIETSAVTEIQVPLSPNVSEMDWPTLHQQVANCQQCDLRAGCTQTVFGVGNPQADIMFIGEAPGAEEDRQGEPFVGRAGRLLNEMLRALKLQRHEVYIANVIKCRPPGNRDPHINEVAHCEPYLKRQVELVQPKVMVALGRIAAQNLLKSEQSLGKMRNQVFHYGEGQTPVVVTYHPAYLLRNPIDKRKAWQDLCRIQAISISKQVD